MIWPGRIFFLLFNNIFFFIYGNRPAAPWLSRGPVKEQQADAEVGVVHFWPLLGSMRARESGRSVAVRFDLWGCFVPWRRRPSPALALLELSWTEAQQSEPVRMALVCQQFPWALAVSLCPPAAMKRRWFRKKIIRPRYELPS